MLLYRYFTCLTVALYTAGCAAASIRAKPTELLKADKRELLQDLVTWDEHSIYVRGERILFFSGEFHPFRIPVTSLYLDVFQKIKALGYSGVSFYVDWALLEGQEGVYNASGIFDLQPFFDAASEAGIYLLARPGPYINAEVSGGGFPGWCQRLKGILRTNDTDFLDATDLYMNRTASTIAGAQITNGGPVILVQVENEYTTAFGNITFPNGAYFAYIENQLRSAGIVVPLINNDASPKGIFAPGTGEGAVDIYGHDGYPLGFDCANPYVWPDAALPFGWRALHELQSPTTPYAIVEFQGGSFDPWGGSGFTKCTTLLNEQFERVFYKNDFSFGVTIFNTYMVFGGTNWGNLGHPLGYTSYDYGAAIAEDRSVGREKYSELKLEANFWAASPAYLTAVPGNGTNGSFVDNILIADTQLLGNGSATNFYIVRHAAYNTNDSTNYTLSVTTSAGAVTIPQLDTYGSALTLNGRDSKVHVTDYDLGGTNLVYSSAEVFTWQNYTSGTVVVLYGGAGEVHELAVDSSLGSATTTGGSVTAQTQGNTTVVQWVVTPERQTATFNGLTVYLLWRNEVYNWWALELPAASPISNYTSPSKTRLIAKAGYLLRSATIVDNNLYITGDVNATTTLEIVGGAPSGSIYFNGQSLTTTTTSTNTTVGTITYTAPSLSIPDLSSLDWSSIDNLPEVGSSYDDSAWTICNQTTSNNPLVLSTPTSLYASDYGYHAGSLIYRGHFTSSTNTTGPTLTLLTQGGAAYGYSVFLNSNSVYSYPGISTAQNDTADIPLPDLTASTPYIITVVIDHMGLTENFNPGGDTMKQPRGILSYNLSSYDQSAITWKITGNLGGESYIDKTRGPLNEGAFFAERQGYHLPGAPTTGDAWTPSSSPFNNSGITGEGARFFVTTFDLDLPSPQYDIPLSFVFSNTTNGSNPADFRSQLFVNGYQFGKYVNNIGPQVAYPVPEGILDYHGTNTLGLSVWSQGSGDVVLGGLALSAETNFTVPVLTGRGEVVMSPITGWTERPGAY